MGLRAPIFTEPTWCGDIKAIEPYNAALKEVAQRKKCLFADPYAPFQAAAKANPYATLAIERGQQPNAQGYLFVAREVLKAFGLNDAHMAQLTRPCSTLQTPTRARRS